MNVPDEEPTREIDDRGVTTERHPAFGMIGASRYSSSEGAYLHGSDFRHQHGVMISIKASSLRRDLSHDWIHSDNPEYIRLSMSEAQWATFVSSMNVGDGVACTIERLEGKALPGIARVVDRRAQFQAELTETMNDAINGLKKVRDAIGSLKLPMKKHDELLAIIAKAQQEIACNVPFVAKSFDEHTERTVERAKIEVNAYLQAAIVRTGIRALADQPGPLQLEPGKDRTDEA